MVSALSECVVDGCEEHRAYGISVCGVHEREWDRAWRGVVWADVPIDEKQAAWARLLRGDAIRVAS